MIYRPCAALAALLLISFPAFAEIPMDWRAALNRIRADSLRGHLSFLASDLLEGRDTPSRGLDLAAEYIAAQFRRAGLEPLGNNGYFHESDWEIESVPPDGLRLSVTSGSHTVSIDPASLRPVGARAMEENDLRLIRWTKDSKRETVEGNALLLDLTSQVNGALDDVEKATPVLMGSLRRASELRPKVILIPDKADVLAGALRGVFGEFTPRKRGAPASMRERGNAHTVLLRQPELIPEGDDVRIQIKENAPTVTPMKLRNVAGVLRGGDPVLRDTYIFITAHFDHVGVLPTAKGDRVFNGANDDASGTVTVLEIAAALASLPVRPRRSVVFMAVSGEEKGLLGSAEYLRSPTVPLESIVANINLEVLGRPDTTEGSLFGKASMTGFDYSNVPQIIAVAGSETGVEVFKHDRMSDTFFNRSDNISFAVKGIPAHTVFSGYPYAEYHTRGDEWQKIDYENMEKLARTVALGVLRIADAEAVPEWNSDNPRTEKYREAARKLRKK